MTSSISTIRKMKSIRSSCEGYLTLRPSPSAPPPMIRRYCVLIGTHLYFYNVQEDAEHLCNVKGQYDILGVQEWDGKGNTHIYVNGFLFSTSQNKIFYGYADTAMEKEKWIRAMQMFVMTTVPNLLNTRSGISSWDRLPVQFSPESTSSPRHSDDSDTSCPCCSDKNPQPGRHQCYSCKGNFCSTHSSNEIPLPQNEYYLAKRVCDECFRSQIFLNYLRAIVERLQVGICVYPRKLNINTPIDLLTPSSNEPTSIAVNLFNQGQITNEELEMLLTADKRYQDQTNEDAIVPLDVAILSLHREFHSPNFTVCRNIIMLHENLDKDPMLFKPIVEKLLSLSYTRIDDVEMYWPQIVHAYLRIPIFDFEKLFWMDELILSICDRSIHLALLLIWQLQGALEDSCSLFKSKDITDKYARILRLFIEIEINAEGKTFADLFQKENINHYKIQERPPKPTEDQLYEIIEYLNILSTFRKIYNSERNSYPSVQEIFNMEIDLDINTNTKIIELHHFPSYEKVHEILEETLTDENKNDEINDSLQLKDCSKFQIHLLTPTTRPNLEISAVAAAKEDVDNNVESKKDVSRDHEKKVEIPCYVDELKQSNTKEINSIPAHQSRPRTLSKDDKSVLRHYVSDAREFFQKITDIAEDLRFLPQVSERKHKLAEKLKELVVSGRVYVPLVKTTDPFERIIRIPPGEATAFSTKARVPIMLIFEVFHDQETNNMSNKSNLNSPIKEETNNDTIDDEVGKLIEKESPHAFNLSLKNSDLSHNRRYLESLPSTPIDGMSCSTPTGIKEDQNGDEDDEREMPTDLATLDLSHIELSKEVLEREEERKHDLEAAFGESWDAKRKRLQQSSPHGKSERWNLISMIGKSNDDLRQEVFTLQIISKFMEVFKRNNLPLWLKFYRIIATSASTGLIETLQNAISLDGLKKREGYVSLMHHFERSYGPRNSLRFQQAQRNFVQSMAAYSLVCYFLQIKDRHNGNIMLDNEGHIIHIDYGFLLGIAPGGSFSIETAPFKLSAEMVETMGGVDSDVFKEYITLCTRGFLASQKHCNEICDLVEIMAQDSTYPCFANKDITYIIQKLRSRFKVELSKKDIVAHVLYLIRKSNNNYSTRQYDNFQRMTNGILP